jgi:hypothetical protein
LENLASLEHVTAKLNCGVARRNEVEGLETKVRDAISIHPKHPTLELSRLWDEDNESDNDSEPWDGR